MNSKESLIRKEFRKYKTYKLDIRNKEILLETLKNNHENYKSTEIELNILKLKVEYLDNLIAPLPTRGKKAIYLALVENLPIYAVAERMGVAPNSISGSLSWNIKNKLSPRFNMEMFKDENIR